MTAGTAVALIQKNDLVALNPQSPEVEAMLYNIKLAGGVKDSDLRKVKNPSGGSVMFEITAPGGRGEPEYARELEGVVLYHGERRTLWKDKNVGSGELPVCSSKDMVHGKLRTKGEGDEKELDIPQEIIQIGMPGGTTGLCADCPFDEWGTATDAQGKPTRGKQCGEKRLIYLLRKDEILPIKITVPPGSLGAWGQALLNCKFKLVQGGIVKISLVKASPKKGGGPDFAQFVLTPVAPLTEEAKAGLQEYGKLLTSVFETATAD